MAQWSQTPRSAGARSPLARPRAHAPLTWHRARASFRTILVFSLLYVIGMTLLTCCAGLVPTWAPAPGEPATKEQTGACCAA